VSYNLLMLAAPPCAALACYALCRELSERFWPLPLLVLIAVRYCRARISSRRAIATSATLLLFVFGS
jgi:hypothetical protein